MQDNHNENWQDKALLYAYGELPPEQEADFLAHLKYCKDCQKIIRTSALLNAALPQIKAPQGLSIPLEIPQQAKKPLFKGLLNSLNLRLLVPAGAMALMLLVALGFYKTANMYLPKQTAQQDYIDDLYAGVYNIEDEVEDIIDYIDNL